MEETGALQQAPMRILLVEDNRGDARLLKEYLKEAGLSDCIIHHHTRLDEAVRALALEPSDVALLDLGLPDSSGLATLQRFNQSGTLLPVVVLTGLDDEELALEALSLGAQDYIVKGQIDPPVLARTLRYAIARHRRDNAARANNGSLTEKVYAGLPLRDAFDQKQRDAVLESERRESPFALYLISLQRFHTVTDVFGEGVGEVLVREASRRIHELVDSDSFLASLGGNDLGLIWPTINNEEQAEAGAREMLSSLCKPYRVDQGELFLACTIGITLYRPGGKSQSDLLRQADSALQKAKLEGGSSFRLYQEKFQREAARQLALDSALRMALKHGEFVLHFQPCVDIQRRQVSSFEALIRWRHPDWGLAPPAEFIPAAEASGLIQDIDMWALVSACQHALRFMDHAGRPIAVAVNFSAANFVDPHLARRVREILKKSGLPPHLLEVELTETALVQSPEIAIRVLKELKALGVKISLDDFGVGYSSLSYLRQLPVDILKIDRSFVNDIGLDDQRGSALVESVISLAKSLNLIVTAEGVETLDQLEWLKAKGCDRAQGYLFAKPAHDPDVQALERRFATLSAQDDFDSSLSSPDAGIVM